MKNSVQKLFAKVKEVGLRNTIVGVFRRCKYKRLQKKYGFYTWHISPYELRGYAIAVANYVSKNADCNKEIVDMGCGLGEILRHIKTDSYKLGYDPDPVIIDCAKQLNKDSRCEYEVAGLGDFGKDHDVDYFITLGFMHGALEETWYEPYHKIASENNIEHFIVDVCKEGFDGAHALNFAKILPNNYSLETRLGPFLSGRYVEIYKKN